MRIEEIKKVCFVGAGTMGCYNSLLAGMAGYEAVVYDHSEEAKKSQMWSLQKLILDQLGLDIIIEDQQDT